MYVYQLLRNIATTGVKLILATARVIFRKYILADVLELLFNAKYN